MQVILKNRKTKKQARNKLQRGGSGRTSGRTSSDKYVHPANELNMPMAFYKIKNELKHKLIIDSLPPVPKYIPYFSINVKKQDLEELLKIFTNSPTLNKLINTYETMHERIKDLEPMKIKTDLLNANTVFEKMIELLKEQYIYSRSVSPELAMQADKWCDYIQKLIESNKKNIGEINEFLAV